jgi:hypothetical protein
LNQALDDALSGQQAIQLARSDRQNAQIARMISNLTIQVQASVNIFQMQESTLNGGSLRGAGGVSSGLGGSVSSQLLTLALRPNGGDQLNLFA